MSLLLLLEISFILFCIFFSSSGSGCDLGSSERRISSSSSNNTSSSSISSSSGSGNSSSNNDKRRIYRSISVDAADAADAAAIDAILRLAGEMIDLKNQ